MAMKDHLDAWSQQTDDTLVEAEYLESVAQSVAAAFAFKGSPEDCTRIRLEVLGAMEASFVRCYVGRFKTNPHVAAELAVAYLRTLVDRHVPA